MNLYSKILFVSGILTVSFESVFSQSIDELMMHRRIETIMHPTLRGISRSGIGNTENAPIRSYGSPKIPIFLVNFSDVRFSVKNTDSEIREYYDKFCNGYKNGTLYTEAGSYGAVRDYFVQQSDSIFTPEFVVFPPVTLSREMAYYGQNSESSKDVNYREFCKEALQLASEYEEWNPQNFDNNNDGTVDLAFFIYAGQSEADAGVTPDAIWPKEMISPTIIDGITFSVSACCNELMTTRNETKPSGIGVMCHELSHSIGLPDMYDTGYKALGMSYWSLMDCGNYCENGYIPCGLTSYERDFLKWRSLEELTEPCTVRLIPLEKGGKGYKITSNVNPDEYYILENRYPTGWDKGLELFGNGMLTIHADYDKSAWESNRVNTDPEHQRMSFFPANNKYINQYNATSAAELVDALQGQLYPYNGANTELSPFSTPQSILFTGGTLDKPVKDIKVETNGDITFKFMPLGKLDKINVESVSIENKNEKCKLKWEGSENAECYNISIYKDNETTVIEQADSVTACEYEIKSNIPVNNRYKITITAMADKYENSDVCIVYTDSDTDGIMTPGVGNEELVTIYNIQGTKVFEGKLTKNTELNIKPGIYIMKTATKTTKFINK